MLNSYKTLINGIATAVNSAVNSVKSIASTARSIAEQALSVGRVAQTQARGAALTASEARSIAEQALSEGKTALSKKADLDDPKFTNKVYVANSIAVGGSARATLSTNSAAIGLFAETGKLSDSIHVNSAFAAGWHATAASDYQFAQGKLNIVDRDGKYAHIVGNGYSVQVSSLSSKLILSNAYTLDWNGTPWYQSRPQFGGNAQDNGSQTVMANGDKEIVLSSSTEGSSKQFKITVDDECTVRLYDTSDNSLVNIIKPLTATIDADSTDEQSASAKAVYDAIQAALTVDSEVTAT